MLQRIKHGHTIRPLTSHWPLLLLRQHAPSAAHQWHLLSHGTSPSFRQVAFHHSRDACLTAAAVQPPANHHPQLGPPAAGCCRATQAAATAASSQGQCRGGVGCSQQAAACAASCRRRSRALEHEEERPPIQWPKTCDLNAVLEWYLNSMHWLSKAPDHWCEWQCPATSTAVHGRRALSACPTAPSALSAQFGR